MPMNYSIILLMKVFSLRKMVLSFRYAFRGLKLAFLEQQSFRFQLVIGVVVIILMFYFPLSFLGRAILFLSIFIVLSLEVVNSIFEKTMDIFEPRINPHVGKVKDMMAAAVLLAAIGSITVGILIFLPYFR